VAKGWKLKLIRPTESIKTAVNKGWGLALQDIENWIEDDLADAMVYGNLGIQGIAETPFYRYISSPDGISQLGIEKSDPPKLLEAYKRTIKVSRNNRLITVRFGNESQLKLATPHPHAGVKHLHVKSWLEFIVDGVNAQSGFVPRARLPRAAQKNIRVQSAPGGLMLPQGRFGSTGTWRFPANFANYESKWLKSNAAKIEKALQNAAIRFLSKRIS